MARRRRVTSRRKTGRQGLWIRQQIFQPQGFGNGLYTALIATPADWEREAAQTSNPKRGAGGTVLQRIIGSFQLSLNTTEGFSDANTFIEVMLWVQDAAFASLVSDSASFDTTFEGQRLLHYDIMTLDYQSYVSDITDELRMGGRIKWDLKSKARLADQAIGIALRLNYDPTQIAVNDQILGITSSVYVTTP